MDGIYKEYHRNGDIKIEGLYLNGEKDKMWSDYSVGGLMKRELFYDQNILLYEVQHLAPSTVTEENKSKILRLIHYSGKIPTLPYYSVWFNAKLDGQLFVDGQKVIDLKKGEEIELLIEEREFSYSYRYAKGGPHRLDMQIDSIVLSKECEEYLVLLEDSVINKSIYDNKINELLIYLENPIEANYNYDWNKKEEKFISDSLGLDLLDQVFRRRQEVTIKELTKFIKDVTASEFKDLWFYESYVWDNNELDSLTVLAYYLKNDDITNIAEGSNYYQLLIDHKDAQPSFNSGDIKCLFNEHQDTLIFNNLICDYDTEAERLNIDSDNYCSFLVLFDGHRINGFKFDVLVTCNEGSNGTGFKTMVLSNSDGEKKFLDLSEDYAHQWYGKGVSTKVSFDGKFEIEVSLFSDSESFELENSQQIYFNKYYSVVLDYELNDQMELVFKGIRKINYIM